MGGPGALDRGAPCGGSDPFRVASVPAALGCHLARWPWAALPAIHAPAAPAQLPISAAHSVPGPAGHCLQP